MSSIIIADKTGNALGLELAGKEIGEFGFNQDVFTHTNHYLAIDIDNSDPVFQSSHQRLSRARYLALEDSNRSVEKLQSILRDNENGANAICHSFVMEETIGLEGTLCAVVFDLAEGSLYMPLTK